MRIARPSVIVGVAVTAVLLAGCGRGQQEQSVAEQLVNAQGQAAGAGQAGGPDGTGSPTGSPDDASTSPSTSPSSDDRSSDEPTSDDSSAGTAGHSESESPESHAASPSSSRTKSESASPRATSRPRPSTSPTHGGGGGGGGGGTSADRIRVSKCYTNATSSTGGELLIKASSSDPNATLVAYTSQGSRIGEVQNGGGSRYGGTVMPYQPKDPGACVIKSSSGGSISVPTTPFKL